MLIGYGSTFGSIREVCDLDPENYGYIHLPQVWPFPDQKFRDLIGGKQTLLTVEANAGAKLAKLIKRETGVDVNGSFFATTADRLTVIISYLNSMRCWNMDLQTYNSPDEIAWCPGCGNFGILTAVKKALLKLEKKPQEVLMVSGIGQAAKLPHYIKCNCFNGLHGRALPVAAGAKIANRDLTVIVTTGDGDCYGEGGNHFIHNIRRNVDMTVIVHNNQIYGLTKGQASPTTDVGYQTTIQPGGVVLEPFHALAVAITLGAGFVARGYSGHFGCAF